MGSFKLPAKFMFMVLMCLEQCLFFDQFAIYQPYNVGQLQSQYSLVCIKTKT